MSRVGLAIQTGLRDLRRTPVLVALLVAGPAYMIWVFSAIAPDGPATVYLGTETVQTTLSAVLPAVVTPMTAALLSGVAGLFLMQTAASADSRLVVAGYRPAEVVLARFGLVAAVAATATLVSTAVMLTTFQPARPGWFLLGTGLAALSYGLVGVVVGALADRLVGVYLLVFGSLIDLFVFQNPLATDTPALGTVLPGHFALAVTTEAGFAESAPVEPVAGALAYLVVLACVAVATVSRTLRV
ncbi:hypothetical protein [Halovenus halobia]|uniref:hypothetical protein n=1 Tax=Halovenus halobia TaxID=3396622 RepID=UPI003F57067D